MTATFIPARAAKKRNGAAVDASADDDEVELSGHSGAGRGIGISL